MAWQKEKALPPQKPVDDVLGSNMHISKAKKLRRAKLQAEEALQKHLNSIMEEDKIREYLSNNDNSKVLTQESPTDFALERRNQSLPFIGTEGESLAQIVQRRIDNITKVSSLL